MSMHRQADVVFGQRLRGGARTDYILELGKLPALIERIVVVEAMQHGSHPPGKTLHFRRGPSRTPNISRAGLFVPSDRTQRGPAPKHEHRRRPDSNLLRL